VPFLYLDIETRSELDVTKVGPYAYAEHPSTRVLCIAYALGDAPVRVWQGDEPDGSLSRDELDRFHGVCIGKDDGLTLVAHNVEFEASVLDLADWPWLDTAALAAGMGLPRKLEDLAIYLWPDEPDKAKDMEGSRIMLQLTKPRRPSQENPDRWWTPRTAPEKFERLYPYCAQDVEVMRAAHKRLRALDPQEEEIRQMTARMNRRGIRIDTASIRPAQEHLEGSTRELAEEFRALVGRPVKSYAKVAESLGLENVRKPTVRKALRRPDLPARTRRALEIFVQLSRSSTAKLEAFEWRTTRDGRLRGAFTFCGAERTGRWSSSGAQLQNLRRGLGEQTELAFRALHAGALSLAFVGEPKDPPEPPLDDVSVVADMLRGYLVGPFWVGDLAQIEARTLAWLAGQADLVQAFRDKADPYCMMAAKIYGRPVVKKDKAERFMGKQVVLGAGYGLGSKGFSGLLDETYDVQIEDSFARRVIKTYRTANPAIVRFWRLLEAGLAHAIRNRSDRIRVQAPGGVALFMGLEVVGGLDYAWIELPSGRRIRYGRPEIRPDGSIRYYGRDLRNGGRWGPCPTYGGKIAENVTQAVSRDVIAEAMLRLEAAGYPLVGTVHDEVIAEKSGKGTLQEFHKLLTVAPKWADGLPIEAESFECERYRK